MNWIALFFALEAGIVTENAWLLYDKPVSAESPMMYTEFEAEILLLDHIFLRSRLRTDVQRFDYGFNPVFTAYDNILGIRFDPVEIGFRHVCVHPLQTYLAQVGDRVSQVEGAFDEVYIRFEYSR